MPRRKLQQGRRHAVDLHLRIAFHEPENLQRLFAENESRNEDRVTPDVHQASAAPLGPAANVLRFAIHFRRRAADRKSTRLNSSHRCISYAVFCLKKKTTTIQ